MLRPVVSVTLLTLLALVSPALAKEPAAENPRDWLTLAEASGFVNDHGVRQRTPDSDTLPNVHRVPSSGDAAAQEALDRVIAVVEQHGIPGARAAARANGLIVGDPRPPLRPVEAHIEAAIGVAVANAQEH